MSKSFKERVFYEVYPSSFCDGDGDGLGDLKGLISRLDYIAGLGFDAVWLNPIYDSPFKDGGYDVRDFYKIAPRFGTMDDLKQLIFELHARDMILFMDLIPGHTSFENPDFLRSAEAVENESSDLFIWNDSVWDLEPGYRLISGLFDRNGCYLVNFFAHQPAINYGFAKCEYPWQIPFGDPRLKGKEYLEKIMNFYLDLGVNGFRVDMADSLVKGEDDKECTISLWQEIVREVEQRHSPLLMTSEWSNPERALRAGFTSDFVLDHQGNFLNLLFRHQGGAPLLHVYDQKVYKDFVADLKWRLEAAERAGGCLSLISGNHDTIRLSNYLQPAELPLAYFFLLTMPGVPYLFAGDELGQKADCELTSKEGGYHRTGTRIPMVFDRTANGGFSSATSEQLYLPADRITVSAAEQAADPASLLNLIKSLIELRHEEEDLTSNSFELLDLPLSYRRGKIAVYLNLLDRDQRVNLGSGTILLDYGKAEIDCGQLVLGPHSALIFKEYSR